MNFQSASRILLWVVVAMFAVATLMQVVRRMDRTDPVIIKSYEVPADIASEVRTTLANVLSRGESENPLGKVSMLPNGQLVIVAPVSVQAGVQHILEEIQEAKPAPTPMIGFELWTVTATPGDFGQLAAELAEVEAAIDAIRKTTAPMKFELREKLSTVTRSGQSSAEVAGTGTRMEIRASLRKDAQDQPLIAAEVDVHVYGLVRQQLQLEASAELRPDELFVMGQSAVTDSRGGPEGPSSQIYYILRAKL